MKTTKVFLAAVIIFFGVILSDGNAKPANSNNDNSEGPRRRIVTTHCYVRPVVYVRNRERREYREDREYCERREYGERRENREYGERREYSERRENRENREHDGR
jgi:hypothetical protein